MSLTGYARLISFILVCTFALVACNSPDRFPPDASIRKISLNSPAKRETEFLLTPAVPTSGVPTLGSAQKIASRTQKLPGTKAKIGKIEKFHHKYKYKIKHNEDVTKYLLGLTKEEVNYFLGPAKIIVILMPYHIVEYRLPKCRLKLYFFPDVLTEVYRVLRVETTPANAQKTRKRCPAGSLRFASFELAR